VKSPLVRVLRSGDRPAWALFDEISAESALELYAAIATTEGSPLILLDSPGGSVSLMLGLGSALAAKYPSLEIRVVGGAQSAAVDLLQFAALRTASPGAWFLTHPTSSDIPLTSGTAKSAARRLEDDDERIYKLYERRTGRPVRFWKRHFSRERTFGVDEALELGLIDRVVGEL